MQKMVDEMGHTVSYREVRTTRYFYFLYKSQHSGRRAKQFLILIAIKMDIKRIFNGCHIPIPHENSTYNTENAHEIPIFLKSSVIYVIIKFAKGQTISKANYGTVHSRFKIARFNKESRFKKDCCYN